MPQPEIVLLSVRGSENVVSNGLKSDDSSDGGGGEFGRVESEVSSLKGVGEGDPSEISEGEHESEAVGGDVHLGEDGGLEERGNERTKQESERGQVRTRERLGEGREEERQKTHLVENSIDDVEGVEEDDHSHGRSDSSSESTPLLASARDVEEHPEDESWSKLVEGLDVKVSDRRVKLSTHPELAEATARQGMGGRRVV